MPNTKSAIRRTKKTKIQATVKEMNSYITAGKIKEAKAFLSKFNSQLMKIAKTGVIKRKTASRKISRITKAIQKIKK